MSEYKKTCSRETWKERIGFAAKLCAALFLCLSSLFQMYIGYCGFGVLAWVKYLYIALVALFVALNLNTAARWAVDIGIVAAVAYRFGFPWYVAFVCLLPYIRSLAVPVVAYIAYCNNRF